MALDLKFIYNKKIYKKNNYMHKKKKITVIVNQLLSINF